MAMAMPAGARPAPAPVMRAHPLRQAAPQLVEVADAMPETAPMMEAMTAAEPQPIPHPVAQRRAPGARRRSHAPRCRRRAAQQRRPRHASLFAEQPQRRPAVPIGARGAAAEPVQHRHGRLPPPHASGAGRRAAAAARAEPRQEPRLSNRGPRYGRPREEVGLDIPRSCAGNRRGGGCRASSAFLAGRQSVVSGECRCWSHVHCGA